MKSANPLEGTTFYAIGLSYKKADAETRGRFNLSKPAQQELLQKAKAQGLKNLIVISTCNRTELYGFAQHPFVLIKLLCETTKRTVEEFQEVAFVYKKQEAITHLFRVGCGLDSQILGDFEIIGQLKQAARASKKYQLLNPFLERLINAVIQASKRVKSETKISSGATSVSFASVQYILNEVSNISTKNILLFGIGKIGRNTCQNLVKHTKNEKITVINRTKAAADALAGKFQVIVKAYSKLKEEISKTDILIVATSSETPTITKSSITTNKPILILDVSIPKNVANNVAQLPNVMYIHLDQLSQITDKTLNTRKKQIPSAEKIIKEVESEFLNWLETRKLAPTLKALHSKLEDFKTAVVEQQRKKSDHFNEEQAELISSNIIQKITNFFAHHLKEDAVSSNESLELLQKVFQIEEKTENSNHV